MGDICCYRLTDSGFPANTYIPKEEFFLQSTMKKGVLDNPRVIARLDPSGMLGAVDSSPELLLNPLSMENRQRLTIDQEVEQMGSGAVRGSALAADVVRRWLIVQRKSPAVVLHAAR